MAAPVLYILAGPNGIGKTTSAYNIIPANIPIINSDEIAKLVRTSEMVKVNSQEFSNREAQRLVKEQLDKRGTFAIETNLADEATWKFLIGVQRTGYRLHLVFLSTDDVQLLNNRIEERHKRGEHFVRPDIVEERYYVGLRLLNHYISFVDVAQLIDNSLLLSFIAIKKDSQWKIISENLPSWFTNFLAVHFNPPEKTIPAKNLSTIEEVKQ